MKIVMGFGVFFCYGYFLVVYIRDIIFMDVGIGYIGVFVDLVVLMVLGNL